MPDIYGLTEEQAPLRAKAAKIASEVLAKHAQSVDSEARFPKEAVAALGSAGLLGLCVPKASGGLGEGPAVFCAVAEELAKCCASTAMVFVMHISAAKMIEASSTLQKRTELLSAIAQGKYLTTLALSERGSRSQFWAPVSALFKSPGQYTTSAFKSWVTSAHHADGYLASAQMPGASSPAESTLYLLPRERPGVRVDGNFDGLGLRGNDSAPVSIEDAKIAEGELLTEHGKGGVAMLEVVLPWFSAGSAAMSHGLCVAAVEATAKHLSNTGFEHTGTSLRDLPTLRARLAEMSLRTEQSRALLGFTLAQMAAPTEATPLYVLESRMSALKAAADVTNYAMLACGGAAFSKHLGVERLFRDARAGLVMAPTVDHLADFIGRALTGLPLF